MLPARSENVHFRLHMSICTVQALLQKHEHTLVLDQDNYEANYTLDQLVLTDFKYFTLTEGFLNTEESENATTLSVWW